MNMATVVCLRALRLSRNDDHAVLFACTAGHKDQKVLAKRDKLMAKVAEADEALRKKTADFTGSAVACPMRVCMCMLHVQQSIALHVDCMPLSERAGRHAVSCKIQSCPATQSEGTEHEHGD